MRVVACLIRDTVTIDILHILTILQTLNGILVALSMKDKSIRIVCSKRSIILSMQTTLVNIDMEVRARLALVINNEINSRLELLVLSLSRWSS